MRKHLFRRCYTKALDGPPSHAGSVGARVNRWYEVSTYPRPLTLWSRSNLFHPWKLSWLYIILWLFECDETSLISYPLILLTTHRTLWIIMVPSLHEGCHCIFASRRLIAKHNGDFTKHNGVLVNSGAPFHWSCNWKMKIIIYKHLNWKKKEKRVEC